IDPNAAQEVEELAEDEEAEIEADEAEEEEDDDGGSGGGANSAALAQLKADAMLRFTVIHELYGKLYNTLVKKGSQDKTYLKIQEETSAERLYIPFTAKPIGRLSASVRHMVDQVRSHERKILSLCVDKSDMPRPHVINTFPGHETDMEWPKAE